LQSKLDAIETAADSAVVNT